MKFMMLLGGMIGFTSMLFVGLSVGKPLLSALGQASLGSVACGLLFLWVGQIWIRSVKQVLLEKKQAAMAAMAEAEERNQTEAKARGTKPV